LAVIARPTGWVDVLTVKAVALLKYLVIAAITKYLSRATARRPCGRQTAVPRRAVPRRRQTIAAVESFHSCYCLAANTHSSPAK